MLWYLYPFLVLPLCMLRKPKVVFSVLFAFFGKRNAILTIFRKMETYKWDGRRLAGRSALSTLAGCVVFGGG